MKIAVFNGSARQQVLLQQMVMRINQRQNLMK